MQSTNTQLPFMMQCTNPKLQFCVCQRPVPHSSLFCTVHGYEPRNVWIVPRIMPWSLLFCLAVLECDEGVVSASIFMSCYRYLITRLSSLTHTKWSCPSYLVWSIWSLECAWVLSIMCKYTVMEQKFTVVPVCSMKAYRRYRGTDRHTVPLVLNLCSMCNWVFSCTPPSLSVQLYSTPIECSAALHRPWVFSCTPPHWVFSCTPPPLLPVTCWIGDWIRPGMCLDTMEQIKISAPAGSWNLNCPACSLVTVVTVVTELFWFQVSVF